MPEYYPVITDTGAIPLSSGPCVLGTAGGRGVNGMKLSYS